MKNILFIIFLQIVIFYSCSGKRSNETNEKIVTTTEIDKSNSKEANTIIFDPHDSLSFIDFALKFDSDKTNEIYVELYFKKNLSVDEVLYDKITKSGDSLIYEDEMIRRTRIPLNIAAKYFDFSGLEPLSVYDAENNFLSKAHFKRVEFLNQPIAPGFIAVFETEKHIDADIQYCIGNLNDKLTPAIYKSYEDSVLTNSIVQKFEIKHLYPIEGTHYKKDDSDYTLTVINSDTTSCFVEKTDNDIAVIYSSTQMEHINKIVFIPIIINKKPIILVESFLPESDMSWNSLFIFDGKQYQIKESQRI
jgi:hypothetical protein